MKFIPLHLGNPKDPIVQKPTYYSPLSIFSYKLNKNDSLIVTFSNGDKHQIKESEEQFLALLADI